MSVYRVTEVIGTEHRSWEAAAAARWKPPRRPCANCASAFDVAYRVR